MPERTGPNPYDNWANDINRRLRDVERKNPGIPDSSNPLQTYEDGSPLGDTFHLDFGANISATPLGGGYVVVEGSAAGAGPWDAIVDASIAATDTDVSPPIFKTSPGEALAYLTTLGFTRANVFVRPGTYTETANVTPPANVFLFGAPGGGEDLVIWNRGANFTMAATRWHLCNITVDLLTMTTLTTPFGTPTRFYAENCIFKFGSSIQAHPSMTIGTTSEAASSFCFFINCGFFGMRKLGAVAEIIGGECSGGSGALIAGTLIKIDGMTYHGGNMTWTIPQYARIVMNGLPEQGRDSTATSGQLIFSQTSGSQNRLHFENNGVSNSGPNFVVSLAGSGYEHVCIKGRYQSITVPANASYATIIEACVNNTSGSGIGADIGGPAIIDLDLNFCRAILRGNRISGHITASSGTVGPGTQPTLSYIGAKYCNIDLAVFRSSSSGKQVYTFDATSDFNILDAAGASTFDLASTDAGANNLIRTT